ncbi:MAG: hypothetical protein SOV20_08820 [Coriobacteriales bacterium]|nr:hypothetical protein [Coriobacteriaceae bacterium]MDY2723900.1 hypothetical protein [Coriobacteriales bacterium]
MAAKTNNPKDVSTVRGVKGGYLFMAPYGTKLPTDRTTALDDAFVNRGYISGDGMTESVDIDTSDDVQDQRGDVVITGEPTKYTEKLTMTLISMNKDALAVQYGSGNVTDSEGEMVVKHNWSDASTDRWSAVLELVMKNNRLWRKVIPECSITSLGDVSLTKDDAVGREVELTYQTDSDGSGCYDYIQSTETVKSA